MTSYHDPSDRFIGQELWQEPSSADLRLRSKILVGALLLSIFKRSSSAKMHIVGIGITETRHVSLLTASHVQRIKIVKLDEKIDFDGIPSSYQKYCHLAARKTIEQQVS